MLAPKTTTLFPMSKLKNKASNKDKCESLTLGWDLRDIAFNGPLFHNLMLKIAISLADGKLVSCIKSAPLIIIKFRHL